MKVMILKLARDDLRDIRDYLSNFGETPPRKFRANFESFIEQVSDMPYMFTQYEYLPIYRRAVLIYDYLVFYQVRDDEGIVRIYRVLHGKRNIVPLLDTAK